MGFNKKFFITGGIVASSPADEANFNTVLYTGNSTNDQSVTGVGFQPDFVWIKSRNTGTGTSYHGIWDSVRGTGGHLYSSLTNAETSTPNRLYSFDSDGFSLGNGVDPEYIGNNNYVAWCWKAGGTVSANNNTDGDITSTVSANQDAGFSIVKFTSSSNISHTIGHGLSSAPEMIIYKRLSQDSNWTVYTNVIDGSWDYLRLNLNVDKGDGSGTFATPSTIKNVSTSENWIAYCFHSVDGYQKVGTYTGNGNANGTIVTTGFTPRFVMIKGTDQTSDWIMLDSVRDSTNPNSARLDANNNGNEYTGENLMDFNSNGFQLKTSSASKNGLDKKFLYLAIA